MGQGSRRLGGQRIEGRKIRAEMRPAQSSGVRCVNSLLSFLPRFALVVLSALGAPAPARAAIPSDALLEKLQPQGYVNDFAGILNPAERTPLQNRVDQLRRKTGAQFAVVILKSLEGGQIDDFTEKLFKKWGVGEKDKNNGVMLLVAMQDRKARIEVGYGLESILPDALAGRVLDEQLFPSFKRGQYARGLTLAVNRVAEIVERGERAPPERRAQAAPLFFQIFVLLFFGIWTTVAASSVGVGIGTRTVPAIVFGGIVAAIGLGFGWLGEWWKPAPLLPYVIPPYALAVVAASWILSRLQPELLRSSSGRSFRRRGQRGGWDWGGGGSSWSSGGFSCDSGGFSGGCDSSSFGGGSSGGGGASGGW